MGLISDFLYLAPSNASLLLIFQGSLRFFTYFI